MTDLLVVLQNGCCGYGVNEEEGSLTVCAEILTASTDANYIIYEDPEAGSAQSTSR